MRIISNYTIHKQGKHSYSRKIYTSVYFLYWVSINWFSKNSALVEHLKRKVIDLVIVQLAYPAPPITIKGIISLMLAFIIDKMLDIKMKM